MLATFHVKNSTVDLGGVDISGLNNKIEVTISAKTDHQPTGRLHGKVEVVIRQKMFLRETDIDDFINTCEHSHGANYRFTRECLEYTVENVELVISKDSPIAGVVPIELFISGENLPLRKRI